MSKSRDTTSASLLLRVRNPEDEKAWREFEDRYRQLVMRYCRARNLKTADAEDVSQMVWGDLAKGLRSFSYDPSKGRFRSYLGKVVRSATSRYFSRNAAGHIALDSKVPAIAPNDDEGDTIWEKEWVDHHYRLAMRTIERTFEPQSVTIFRRLLGGESAERIASDFSMTVAAVNQSKHRIRTRMKELIARQIQEEDEPDSYGTD